MVPDGTCVVVVARQSLVVWGEGALGGCGIARRLEAKGILSPRFLAQDGRFGVRFALEGKLVQRTSQGAVAQVPVFQGQAVRVVHTVARDLESGALPLLAAVGDRAWVRVVAVCAVVLEKASAQPVAHIVRARVVVVAENRGAFADAFIAMVSDSACVAVEALALSQDVVGASGFSEADILRAWVLVITEVDVIPSDLVRLVGLAVAVVVRTVACLLDRLGCVALGKSFRSAHPLPVASSELVGAEARGEEQQIR